MKPPKQVSSILTGLALTLALVSSVPSARANVYASNIKINGTLTGSASVVAGSGATITYILNEAASLGVAVQIYSGATPIRTIVIASGSAGSLQGLNTVVWDGKNDSNAVVPPGNYTVQVTSVASGFAGWTQIINNSNNKVYWPAGIAVDTNIKSPYYGRVMVANGVTTALNVAPHPVGIVKFNADGSEADEGQSTPPGTFRTDTFLGDSCRSIKYGTDDRIYFLDWVGNGKVWACDMLMTTSQMLVNADLNPTLGSLTYGMADMDITDPGTTNGIVWLADDDYPTVGIYAFPLTNNGVADSVNGGINVVTHGPDIPLRSGYGMEIDEAGDIFIGEVRANSGDINPKLTAITNVWGASFGYPTNWWNNDNNAGAGYPISGQDLAWQDGTTADDTWLDVSAVAINSRTSPTYVSAAFSGGSGGMKIVNAADGTPVATIEQGAGVFDIGTCWDAVGNVYSSNAGHTSPWEVYSPPGPNQATTPAVVGLTVTVPATPPHITSISVSGGTATIHFTGAASDPASAFTLLSSATVNPASSYAPAAGAVITGSAGSYTATVATSGGVEFYRIKR